MPVRKTLVKPTKDQLRKTINTYKKEGIILTSKNLQKIYPDVIIKEVVPKRGRITKPKTRKI